MAGTRYTSLMKDYIDIYCERIDGAFWGEPLNAVSNVFFILSAFMAWRLMRKDGVSDLRARALIVILTAIGVGSFLFHTLATGWAQMADVVPILIFQIIFIYGYGTGVMRVSRAKAAGLLGFFFVLVAGFAQLPASWLNGSLSYAPALIMLLGLGVYHARTGKNAPYLLLAAGGTFIISLTFRSIDMAVCNVLPIGVHYMWHGLNALLLYMVLHAFIRNVNVTKG